MPLIFFRFCDVYDHNALIHGSDADEMQLSCLLNVRGLHMKLIFSFLP
jgi:hypothetical protein